MAPKIILTYKFGQKMDDSVITGHKTTKVDEPEWQSLPIDAYIELLSKITGDVENDKAHDILKIILSLEFIEEDLAKLSKYLENHNWKSDLEVLKSNDDIEDGEFSQLWVLMKKLEKEEPGLRINFLNKWQGDSTKEIIDKILTEIEEIHSKLDEFSGGIDRKLAELVFQQIDDNIEISRCGKELKIWHYDKKVRLWLQISNDMFKLIIGNSILDWVKRFEKRVNELKDKLDELKDSGKISNYIHELARITTFSEKSKKLIIFYIKYSGSTSIINKIVPWVFGMLDERNKFQKEKLSDKINQKKWTLAVQGTTLDSDGEMVPKVVEFWHFPRLGPLPRYWRCRPRVKEDFFSFECPFDPDLESYEAKKHMKMILNEIFCFQKEHLSVYCTVTKLTFASELMHQIIVFVIGESDCGKGTLTELVIKMLDELSFPVKKSLYLLNKQNRGEGSEPYKVAMQGSRFLKVNEINQYEQLDEDKLKEDRSDEIQAPRDNYGSPEKRNASGILWFTSNYLPYVPVDKKLDPAVWEKSIYLFNQKAKFVSETDVDLENFKFLIDKTLKRKLATPEYMAAFFQIIMEKGDFNMKEKPRWANHPRVFDLNITSEVIKWLNDTYEEDLSIRLKDSISEASLWKKFISCKENKKAYTEDNVRLEISKYYQMLDLKNKNEEGTGILRYSHRSRVYMLNEKSGFDIPSSFNVISEENNN